MIPYRYLQFQFDVQVMASVFFVIAQVIEAPVFYRGIQIAPDGFVGFHLMAVFPQVYKNLLYDFFGRIVVCHIALGEVAQRLVVLLKNSLKSLLSKGVICGGLFQSVIIRMHEIKQKCFWFARACSRVNQQFLKYNAILMFLIQLS